MYGRMKTWGQRGRLTAPVSTPDQANHPGSDNDRRFPTALRGNLPRTLGRDGVSWRTFPSGADRTLIVSPFRSYERPALHHRMLAAVSRASG